MKVYLVGGAVRDKLLGIGNSDNDWVVVNSTQEEMLTLGYTRVGKNFPVFLHPKTREEYALARTEKKTGRGHTGFECYSSIEVTLEEDLLRRDLTINAMALDRDGSNNIIDPYGGRRDLDKRVLRHVSDAFSEDPLRLLRVARFSAKLNHFGFRIAEETMQLMRAIASSGHLRYLTVERVWSEWRRSLLTRSPHIFLKVLRESGALATLLPEVEALLVSSQLLNKEKPELDIGAHTLMTLKRAATLGSRPQFLFSATLHDIGNPIELQSDWEGHYICDPEGRLDAVKAVCDRFKVPSSYRYAAMMVCKLRVTIHRAHAIIRAVDFIRLFSQIDAWRRPERLKELLIFCQSEYEGRPGIGNIKKEYPQAKLVWRAYQAAQHIDVKTILLGDNVGEQKDLLRTKCIAKELGIQC